MRLGPDHVLIDPPELERLEQTYQPFPPLPVEWTFRPEWAARQPFLLPPTGPAAAASMLPARQSPR